MPHRFFQEEEQAQNHPSPAKKCDIMFARNLHKTEPVSQSSLKEVDPLMVPLLLTLPGAFFTCLELKSKTTARWCRIRRVFRRAVIIPFLFGAANVAEFHVAISHGRVRARIRYKLKRNWYFKGVEH